MARHHQNSLKFLQSKSGVSERRPFQNSSSFHTRYAQTRVDSRQTLALYVIRNSLILQEDGIIFNLLLRAQYAYNANSYNHDFLCMDGFHGSFVEFIVKETERLHPQARFGSWNMYFRDHLPGLVKAGDDGDCGSSMVCDMVCLQNRVEMKTRNYGQEVRVTQQDDGADSLHKVEPTLVANLYKNWTMPLTKEVQVEYLLRRLD
ncbi:hypothetical protein Peur_042850 [Populus x canadensis]